jgi:hypothetical protein
LSLGWPPPWWVQGGLWICWPGQRLLLLDWWLVFNREVDGVLSCNNKRHKRLLLL